MLEKKEKKKFRSVSSEVASFVGNPVFRTIDFEVSSFVDNPVSNNKTIKVKQILKKLLARFQVTIHEKVAMADLLRYH